MIIFYALMQIAICRAGTLQDVDPAWCEPDGEVAIAYFESSSECLKAQEELIGIEMKAYWPHWPIVFCESMRLPSEPPHD